MNPIRNRIDYQILIYLEIHDVSERAVQFSLEQLIVDAATD